MSPMTTAQDKSDFHCFQTIWISKAKSCNFSATLVLFADRRRVLVLLNKFPPLMENVHGLFRDGRQQNRAKAFPVSCEQCDRLAQ